MQSGVSRLPYEEMIGNPKSRSRYAHLVQFFKSSSETVSCVSEYAFTGLVSGEGIIIIAAEAHNKAIEENLARLEIDVHHAQKSKQLVFLDAHKTLSELMDGAIPDRTRFFQTVGTLVEQTSLLFPLLRGYGEMVDVLASQGNLDGAIALEKLWNELGQIRSFSLLCGYTADLFTSEELRHAKLSICDTHTHIV